MKTLTIAKRDMPEAIELSYMRFKESISALSRNLRNSKNIPDSFRGLSIGEAEDALIQLRTEADRQSTLVLLAAFEALLRVDCFNRIKRKSKSGIGPIMRKKGVGLNDRLRLDDLLDLWQVAGLTQHSVSNFKRALKRRHWLAHGRYWDDSKLVGLDPEDVRAIADGLFSQIPDFPLLN